MLGVPITSVKDLTFISWQSRELQVQSRLQFMAGWQSGHAAACKAVDAGPIPAPASDKKPNHRPGGEMVDTRDLKSLASNGVPVRVRLRAYL